MNTVGAYGRIHRQIALCPECSAKAMMSVTERSVVTHSPRSDNAGSSVTGMSSTLLTVGHDELALVSRAREVAVGGGAAAGEHEPLRR